MILAIDPGSSKSAFMTMSGVGQPMDFGIQDNDDLLDVVYAFNTHDLVIEMVACMGMAVGKTVFETVFWIGRFWEKSQSEVKQRVLRSDVKMAMCGNSRAKDVNIRQSLIDRYGGEDIAIGGKKCTTCKGKGWTGRDHDSCPDCGSQGYIHPPGPLHGVSKDVWSALAVGCTYIDHNREGREFRA